MVVGTLVHEKDKARLVFANVAIASIVVNLVLKSVTVGIWMKPDGLSRGGCN
jgi:hypothetical protein